MQQKYDQYKQWVHRVVAELSDVRKLGMVAFAVIALLITWSGIKVISTNYALQRDIATMQQQNEIRRLQNRNLELQNKFYETDEYIELEARRHFGKAMPGETVWVVSRETALAHLSTEARSAVAEDQAEPMSRARQNSTQWLDFLLYR